MLISPLIGPILGRGFALAIYDFDLRIRSGKNLLLATIVSLFNYLSDTVNWIRILKLGKRLF